MTRLVTTMLLSLSLVITSATQAVIYAPGTGPVADAIDELNYTGDDNGDGVVMEDESGWDCATMGNHVCGTL